MRPLNNKALAVLAVLREGGERPCKDIATTIQENTLCGHCNGTGQGDDSRYGCRRCYGRGQALFGYSDAYVALKQLMARQLVRRRYLMDEWGDETPMLVYSAVNEGDPDDPLEALFREPAAEGKP
jgi:hypothetical protein